MVVTSQELLEAHQATHQVSSPTVLVAVLKCRRVAHRPSMIKKKGVDLLLRRQPDAGGMRSKK
jgi:hypothetical protein